MLLEELRNKLLDIIKAEGKPVQLVAEEMDIDRLTLAAFLKGRVNPRYETLCKIREYINKNSKGKYD